MNNNNLENIRPLFESVCALGKNEVILVCVGIVVVCVIKECDMPGGNWRRLPFDNM